MATSNLFYENKKVLQVKDKLCAMTLEAFVLIFSRWKSDQCINSIDFSLDLFCFSCPSPEIDPIDANLTASRISDGQMKKRLANYIIL